MIEPDLLQQGMNGRSLLFNPATIDLEIPSGSSRTSMPCSMSFLASSTKSLSLRSTKGSLAGACLRHDADGMAHRQGGDHGIQESSLHLPNVAAGAARRGRPPPPGRRRPPPSG